MLRLTINALFLLLLPMATIADTTGAREGVSTDSRAEACNRARQYAASEADYNRLDRERRHKTVTGIHMTDCTCSQDKFGSWTCSVAWSLEEK